MRRKSQGNRAATNPFFFSFHFRGAGLRHVLPFGQKAVLPQQPFRVPADLIQPANLDPLFVQLVFDFVEGGCKDFEFSAQDIVLSVTLFQIFQPDHDCFELLRLLLGGDALSEAGCPLLRWHLVGRTTGLGLWLDSSLHGLEKELMHLLFQTLQWWIQDRNENLKLCKVTKKVSNGLWNGPQLRAHPAEVLGDLIDAEPEAEIQSLGKLIELLAACSCITATLQPGWHRKTASGLGVDLWQAQWQRRQSEGCTHSSVPPPDMTAFLLQRLVSKTGHPWRVRRRARWRHIGWHRFQRSRGCSEQRWSSQRCRPGQNADKFQKSSQKIANCNCSFTEGTIVTKGKFEFADKAKLKYRKGQIEIQRIEWHTLSGPNGPKWQYEGRKRANVGENWAAGADGESDQSIAQIPNLKCQKDCNQLMSTEWPTGS